MELYPHQAQMIGEVRNHLRQGKRKVLLQGATGIGKTVMTAFMISQSAARGKRSMFVVHRQELLHQASRTFTKMGIEHGLVAPGHSMTRDLVQIGMVQTIGKRLSVLAVPDLIIIDEAHHSPAGAWAKMITAWPSAILIGLTATPERLDGKGMGRQYDAMVLGPPMKWLIANKFLAPFRVLAPPIGINADGVKTQYGDYSREELTKVINIPSITGNVLSHYQKHAPGGRAIIFCCSIEHSKNISVSLQATGIRAVHIDGTSDPRHRQRVMQLFGAGNIQALCTVDLISEGFDVPAVEVAILLRPTQSLTVHLQQVGRALRYVPDKTALILDHAGNTFRHGLPDDEREWSLSGRKARKKAPNEEGEIKVTQCDECFACHPPGPVCPNCGRKYESESDIRMKILLQRSGDLEEVDPEKLKKIRAMEVRRARKREDLEKIAKARGYNPSWVDHILASRDKTFQRMYGV
ncbi:MAG: DEAD/DEAH box helicase family protein [Magnetococcus sp. DMHC-1]